MSRHGNKIRIVCLTLFFVFALVWFAFSSLTAPVADEELLTPFENTSVKPVIGYKTYKGYTYRTLTLQHKDSLPTLVFVHGTVGSCVDFEKYMMDEGLLEKFNMLAYDRIGYNYKDKNHVKESIAFERDLLDDLTKEIPNNNIVYVGYSYGGPIALATKKKVKKIVLIAPALFGTKEVIPWALNLYRWKITRWLIPRVWKEASKEKISHASDLVTFENNWQNTPNKILSIHGTSDWIVPYENSILLAEKLPKNQLKFVTLNEAGHALLWTEFHAIKQELINEIN